MNLMKRDKQKAMLKSIDEQTNNYKLFYEFCNIQQNNIKHFYHDLNNHLITLKLLANESKDDYEKYLQNLKQKYKDKVVTDTTSDILINILIEYYVSNSFLINVINEDKVDDIDYFELLNLLEELKKECDFVLIDFKNRTINAQINNQELANKYSNYIFQNKALY